VNESGRGLGRCGASGVHDANSVNGKVVERLTAGRAIWAPPLINLSTRTQLVLETGSMLLHARPHIGHHTGKPCCCAIHPIDWTVVDYTMAILSRCMALLSSAIDYAAQDCIAVPVSLW
jgi:hypothetical protein